MSDLRVIEMSLAYGQAAGIIQSSCIVAELAGEFDDGWYDLATSDVELSDEIAYLESRRLLQRHLERENWVIIRGEADPLD